MSENNVIFQDQLLRAILPEVLIDNFDIERFEKSDTRFDIWLDEKKEGSADFFDGEYAVTPVNAICMSLEIIRNSGLCIRSDWRGGVHAALMQIPATLISRVQPLISIVRIQDLIITGHNSYLT